MGIYIGVGLNPVENDYLENVKLVNNNRVEKNVKKNIKKNIVLTVKVSRIDESNSKK